MRDELQNKLFEKFEWLIPTDGFGLTCDDGWYDLIDTLCGQIDHAIKFENECIERYQEALKTGTTKDWSWLPNDKPFEFPRVDQVKEKFGGLRFYCSLPSGTRYELRGYVDFAEVWSYHICEICGEKGHNRRDLVWIRTLCDTHYNEVKKK